MNLQLKFVRVCARWIGAAVMLSAFAGCAHVGAIPKSPCACVFHPLTVATIVADRARG